MQNPSADTAAAPLDDSYEALAGAQERLLDAEFASRRVVVGRSDDGASIEVVVRELGQGAQAVVMLHGIGSGSATWLESALALSRSMPDIRVVAWDAPGYAESTPLPQLQPKGSDYAARLVLLLKALHIESAVLVGHSLGAFTACATAHAESAGPGPSIVGRVVLISPAGGYGAPGQEAQSAGVREQRISNLDAVGIAGMAEVVGKPGARMCAPDASPQARAWVRWNMARLDDGGYRQAVEMLVGDSLRRYAPVSMPVEVHCGDMDIVTPPAACEATAHDFAASFALIAGPGHASPIERPLAVAALLADTARRAFGAMPA